MRNQRSGLPLLLLLLGCLAVPPAVAEPPDSNAEPLGVSLAFIDTLNTADSETMLALFAPDATVFVPLADSPARVRGKEHIARVFEPLFSQLRESGEGPKYMNLIPRDTNVQINGDTAVVTFHLGEVPDEPLDQPYSFSRRTLVLSRLAGRWLVCHLHASNILIPASGTSKTD